MEYIIQDTTLTAIADAVRGKTGSTDEMSPMEMATAIEGISVGGGGSDGSAAIDGILTNTITSIESNVTKVSNYACYSRNKLVSVYLPNVTEVGTSAFITCSALKDVYLPNVERLNQGAFTNCAALEELDFPKRVYFGSSCFSNCKALKTLVLRGTTKSQLSGLNCFSGTPLGYGTGGYIYIPSDLIDKYSADQYWSSFTEHFRALEDYTVDGTITGALDRSKTDPATE